MQTAEPVRPEQRPPERPGREAGRGAADAAQSPRGRDRPQDRLDQAGDREAPEPRISISADTGEQRQVRRAGARRARPDALQRYKIGFSVSKSSWVHLLPFFS